MKTFKDLYNFLQEYKEDNIISWLEESWKGKDKQESLLRLFAGFGLIDKLNKYTVCKGNFNLKTIEKYLTVKDIFYDKDKNLINLKDKGDSSDLTCISKYNDKHLLLTTSKNLNKTNIGNLDIDKILTNFEQYKDNGYTKSLCICIRNIDDFENMKKQIEKTNKELKSILEKDDTIIIDWFDLNQAFHQFKMYFSYKSFNTIINSNKGTLCLKMHQHLSVLKTLRMKKCNKKNILWGHIQRSGKSYIICGCIIEDSLEKDICNYLVITTAPKETIEQLRKIFDCIQLQDFNIIVLNGKNKKPVLKDKNIIICSKQFLQTKIDNKEKTKSITWLKKLSFDMRFIDESHNGGTTELAQKTLEFYGNCTFTVQITATYSKPINDYNIPKENWILWDIEDIKLCKNINIDDNIDRLVEKHGKEIIKVIEKYSINSIIEEYSKYPELWLLTDKIKPSIVSDIINNTKNNNYGWSLDACFLLKQAIEKNNKIIIKDEFQNEKETLKLWYRIFGKKDKFGIPDKEYSDDMVFLKRIEKICKNPTINSRFIGEGDLNDEPMIIMAFLPQNNINEISKATIKLLKKYNVIPDYEIMSINSKTTNNPKQSIEESRIRARNSGKKGVLVLSGKQCSLGVSINNCDIVLLLNNNMSFDMIYQMMFRCMTEGKNKKCGFVIDLHIYRVIETSIINYASLIKPDIHPKDAIKYILQERLINLNGDHWMQSFGNKISKIDTFCKNIYKIYSSNIENALNHFLERLRFTKVLLTNEEQELFNIIFKNTILTGSQKEFIDKLIKDDEEKIKKGFEKTKVETSDSESEILLEKNKKEDKKINYMDILKHIIPLICLLTIHNKKTSFIEMFNSIKDDKYLYKILIDQTKSWWGKNIDSNILKKFINIYIKYMKDDKEINQIIRTVKELFVKNINNTKQLSQLIDKYLIPQKLEKKNNAEVSTPFKLRQEMLDKIPIDFWKPKKTKLISKKHKKVLNIINKYPKVFEPCCGKGGFLIDIIDRLMEGFKDIIPDEKLRYKKIVEECLYFSDINPTNIFICKLLVDPYNEYKLNYNEGNTLELNIKEKWGIDGFNAIIGNPPYNSSGNTGTGNTIWQKFTKLSLNKWLKKNGYLVYVHPPGWRKPNTTKSKFYGLYELMTKNNQLIYLSIHGIKDGQQTFKCGTRYDWYIIKKISNYKNTIINDENNNTFEINMNNFSWLPNYNIDIIQKILAKKGEDICPIIYNRSNYGSDKKYTSKFKNDEYKYTIIHTIPESGVRYIYSSINDKGHFGISKIIFGQSNINNPIIDIDGEYGMSEHSMAIEVKNLDEAKNIKKCLLSDKFKNMIKSCLWSNYMIDWRLFTYFKKDFWKEFI
jgi:hypothetical protein